jgi:peptidoglycan hydrolase-like protein with peptidoglycan-binding domain
MKNLIAGTVVASLLIIATPVHAASLTADQQQAIISLLYVFGVDAQTISIVALSLQGDPLPSFDKGRCVLLKHDLTIGSSDATTGGEVTLLQHFLRDERVFPHNITGYFGTLTSAAVQEWQAAHGIFATASGRGVVGPKTRALMADCSKNATGR